MHVWCWRSGLLCFTWEAVTHLLSYILETEPCVFSHIRLICYQTKDLWFSRPLIAMFPSKCGLDCWDCVQCLLSEFFFFLYTVVCLVCSRVFEFLSFVFSAGGVYILSVYIDIWAPFPVAGELQLKGVELQTHITVWAIYVIF